MTHRVTKHHRPILDCDGIPNIGTGGVTEEYVCTEKELERAGYRVVIADEMPEHESEFCADPWGGEPPQTGPEPRLGELIELFDINPGPPRAA